MVISGEEMGKLRSLIVHAYSKDDFPEFLMTKYDRDFDNIEGNCYENQVFNLKSSSSL
jgi:hypothetical protein